MRSNSENQSMSGSFDKVKWLLTFVLIAVVVCGNFYFSEPNPIYQPNIVIRVVGVVVISVLALAVAITTQKGKSFIGFAKESRNELRKVVWPTRKETVQTTLIIAVIALVVGLALWGLDSFFLWLIPKLTTLGH